MPAIMGGCGVLAGACSVLPDNLVRVFTMPQGVCMTRLTTETAGNYSYRLGLDFARPVKIGMVWLFRYRVSSFSSNSNVLMAHL